jgi:hypothetical protein
MKRYKCVFRTSRVSVILDVEATDGTTAFMTAVQRHRAHFVEAEIWDETGLVRTLRMLPPDLSSNDQKLF